MRFEAAVLLVVLSSAVGVAQQPQRTPPPSTLRAPSRTDILRGEYGRYRANNDLLYYDLDVRVNPEKKFISGKNTIRFKMLKDDTRIQLELYSHYTIEKIVLGAQTLKYERDHNTVYVDFPRNAPQRPHLLDRVPLLRPAAGARPVWRPGLQDRSGRQALDQHRERRRRIGVVVAQQGLNGATSLKAPTSASPSRTA